MRFHCLVCATAVMVTSGIAVVSHGHRQNTTVKCQQSNTPNRKKAADREGEESDDQPSYQELDKLYVNLVRRHKKVGKAFQTLQKQNEALTKELKEKEKENKVIDRDAGELVDLIRKKKWSSIFELQEEVYRLR